MEKICIYIHTYTHINIHTLIHVCIYIYISIYLYTHICMYVYVDLYTHVCIYTSFYVYKGHRPFGSIVYNRGWLGTAAASARCESLRLRVSSIYTDLQPGLLFLISYYPQVQVNSTQVECTSNALAPGGLLGFSTWVEKNLYLGVIEPGQGNPSCGSV